MTSMVPRSFARPPPSCPALMPRNSAIRARHRAQGTAMHANVRKLAQVYAAYDALSEIERLTLG